MKDVSRDPVLYEKKDAITIPPTTIHADQRGHPESDRVGMREFRPGGAGGGVGP